MFRRRPVAIALVVVHITMLAFYTFPEALVPRPVHAFSVMYVRPLFHQQWRLFAPDPPLCSGVIEVSQDGDTWTALHPQVGHYLERRMVRNISHHVREALVADTSIHPLLGGALLQACAAQGIQGPGRFRLFDRCVTDPADPYIRETRVTSFTP